MCRISAAVTALLILPCLHADEPRTLRPDWILEQQPPLEWVAGVSNDTLLAATTDGSLYALDVTTGLPRSTNPIKTGDGVKLVTVGREAEQPVEFVFTRHGACAIQLGDTPSLKWRFGALPATQPIQADPETLPGWSTACITPRGLLLARTDGQLVLLAKEDGEVSWKRDLGALPIAQMHRLDQTVAVLWKARGLTRVAFVDLSARRPDVNTRALTGDWPLWSTLVQDGLLAVYSSQVVIWPPRETPKRLTLRGYTFHKAVIDVYQPSADDDGPELLVLADGPRPVAHELRRGKRVWPTDGLTASGFNLQTLQVERDHVLMTNEFGPIVCDVKTGHERISCQQAFPTHLIATTLGSGVLYALYEEPDDKNVPLHLFCTPKSAKRDASAGNDAARVYHIMRNGDIRQVTFTNQRLILVETDGLRAYTLP